MADPAEYPGTPRWVKIAGLIVLGVIVIAIIAALVLGGDHGPGRHMSP